MNETASWFDDEDLFENEVRLTLSGQRSAPEVPGYAELRELARGAQGVVYAARQVSTQRDVAVKVLREAAGSDAKQLQRFEREVGLAASLEHPNLVRIYDSGLLGLFPN